MNNILGFEEVKQRVNIPIVIARLVNKANVKIALVNRFMCERHFLLSMIKVN